MVSYNERESLLRNYHHEPVYGLTVVFKCTAALIFLVFLAAIGIQAEVQPEMRVAVSSQASSTQR